MGLILSPVMLYSYELNNLGEYKMKKLLAPEEIIWDKFQDLACELSPENLCCDGELPASQVKKRRASIMKQWGQLERELGRTVTESEVWMLVNKLSTY